LFSAQRANTSVNYWPVGPVRNARALLCSLGVAQGWANRRPFGASEMSADSKIILVLKIVQALGIKLNAEPTHAQ
jgi:hypothetical protein